jgi:hypothetical protein
MPRRKVQTATAKRPVGRPRKVTSAASKPKRAAAIAPASSTMAESAQAGKPALTDRQLEALWFNHKPIIVGLKEQMTRLNGKLRNAYKQLKAETGITRAEAEFAISLEHDEDDKVLHSERRRRMLARWEGHPIGTQGDLFDDRPRTVDLVAVARRQGLEGGKFDVPLTPGTETYQAALAAFHDANAERIRTMKRPTPVEQAAEAGATAEATNGDVRPRHVQQRDRDAIDSLTH